MEKLGIVVDALEIQEIDDTSGYINSLAAPHAAAVASLARIAKARADQEAAEREVESYALKAQYERDLAVRRACFEAQRDQARFAAEAEAFGIRAAAEAEADANKARAASLRDATRS